MVTFSDMMTLLLTFFVLLLSMSSIDKKIITTAFTNFSARVAFISSKKSGEIPTRIKFVKETLTKPWEMLEKKEQIKDVLFPDQELPENINRSTLKKNINIMKRSEGIALVLSDELLFTPGGSDLDRKARSVLGQIVKLIHSISAPVNVSGHTDDTTGPGIDNLELSAQRAMSVLRYFLKQKVSPQRCSVSAYGPNRPIADNDSARGRSQNRRVEILLKTEPHVQTYL